MALHPDVDGLALHVQAVPGDAGGMAPEHGVGLWRAVAGDHLERIVGVEPVLEGEQEVEQVRVDLPDLAGAEVAQQMIDFAQALRNVPALGPIDHRQRLGRVQVLEREGPFADLVNQGPGGSRGKADQGAGAKPKYVTARQLEPVSIVLHFALSPLPHGHTRIFFSAGYPSFYPASAQRQDPIRGAIVSLLLEQSINVDPRGGVRPLRIGVKPFCDNRFCCMCAPFGRLGGTAPGVSARTHLKAFWPTSPVLPGR